MAKTLDSLVGKNVQVWLNTPLPKSYFEHEKELYGSVECVYGVIQSELNSGFTIDISQAGDAMGSLKKVSSQLIFLPIHKIDSMQLKDK